MLAHASIATPPLKRMDWHEHWRLDFLRQMSAEKYFHSQTPRVKHTWSLSFVLRTHCHRPGQSTSSSSPGESFGFGPQLSSVKSCSKPSEEGRWKSLEVLTKRRKSTEEHDVARWEGRNRWSKTGQGRLQGWSLLWSISEWKSGGISLDQWTAWLNDTRRSQRSRRMRWSPGSEGGRAWRRKQRRAWCCTCREIGGKHIKEWLRWKGNEPPNFLTVMIKQIKYRSQVS